MNENIALQRVTLRTLEPTIFNGLIVGVIIAKQETRQFTDSKSTQAGTSRAVLNFTLRDSPQDFINVTYWGKFEAICEVEDNFHIGDVVEIIRPQIVIRKFNDYGEQFRPKVTSPFSLIMNDLSNILHHEGDNVNRYKELLRLPTKPPGFVPIRDLHNGGISIKDTFADILGAVAFASNVRMVKLKNGSEAPVIDVILFDQTHQGIRLNIWNKEYVSKAGCWKPRETIIFVTDVKIDWSGFHKTIVATFSSRSILTENPIGKEAENLARYAKTARLEAPNTWNQTFDIPDVEKIQNVMSIQQIQNRLAIGRESTQNVQFTALIYAVVTQLDLDGYNRLTNKKCGHCKTLIKSTNISGKCENSVCPVGQNQESVEPEFQFDIRMSISDHTGHLNDCRLTGKTAETVLGCSVREFLQMSESDRGKMKWKYLLERCAIRVFVYFDNYQRAIVSVQGCNVADSLEVAERIPVY
ncbi:meiosis-specific with OB domain-containing protein [Coccinella septempunctata]|uniref:meiosis-specific with OB domain-containing protein n=1 Tax=Coccinella septempunctata TaxID=41139 RepID=UPI001D07285B|nr:meiosis-specific with OB domain-containing protein [Coccinella septempunctata]